MIDPQQLVGVVQVEGQRIADGSDDVVGLVPAADREGFGSCTLHGECEAACPKRIDVGVIARMNREYLSATLASWWS